MNFTVFLTAFTVSIDSFVCGLSLSMSGIKKSFIVFGIAVTVLFMCLFASVCGFLLSNVLSKKVAGLGGAILIVIGLVNLFKKENNGQNKKTTSFKTVFLSGLAVGLDGAFATLSLAVMGMTSLFIPFIIAFFHAVMIFFGTIFCGKKSGTGIFKILSPLILIVLGGYKIISAFI